MAMYCCEDYGLSSIYMSKLELSFYYCHSIVDVLLLYVTPVLEAPYQGR
jgi:hypothetical protein